MAILPGFAEVHRKMRRRSTSLISMTFTAQSSLPGRALTVLAAGLLVAAAVACQKPLEDRLADVRALHELGAWEEAEEDTREILQQHPDHPEANYLLGLSQLRQGQPSLAVWPLQLAAREPVLATDADLALSAAYLRLQQHDAALAAADRVLEATESQEIRAQALRIRAATNLGRREWDAALEDADRLLALAPADNGALTMRASALIEAGRHQEAEGTLREIWSSTSPEAAQAAPSAGLGLVRLYAEPLKDPEAAERQLQEVLERYPSNRDVLRFAADFYDERNEPERATTLFEEALDAAPTDLELRSIAANRLAARGEPEEGQRLMEEGADLLGSIDAWFTVSEYHQKNSDPAAALEAMERAVELASTPIDLVSFRYADLLASSGRMEEAEAVAAGLSESTYRDVLMGRLAYDRGEYEQAWELLDKGLRRWPNNPGARYLAGQAALQTGRVERAMSDFREALRAEPGTTDAGLALARIHLTRSQPRLAGEFAGHTLRALKPGEAMERRRQALILLAQAQTELGAYEYASRNLEALAEMEEGALPAALGRAVLTNAKDGPAAAADRLTGAKLDFSDPANEEALRALGGYLAAAGRNDEALRHADDALRAHPEIASLHDMRGRLLFNAGRIDEARASFQRALELEPEFGPALEAMSQVAQASGDGAQARTLAERAATAQPENADYAYRVGQLALAAGDVEVSERWLRQALGRNPVHPAANNDLAWLLASRPEQLGEALTLANRAAEGDPSATILDTLGWVQLQHGQDAEAAETLAKAHALEPASASIAYRLSLALARTGHEERARELLREALAGDAFPEADQAREQLARLEGTNS
jgi:tetratricopeptide (TPR) repeat protein